MADKDLGADVARAPSVIGERPWSIGGVNKFRGWGVFTKPDLSRYVGGGPSTKFVMWVETREKADRICREHNAALAASAAPFVDVSNITEYGLTQKLSNCIRCF